MSSAKIRLLMIVTLLSAFTALPMAANSALVNPITGGNGVTGGRNWTTGVSLGWSVADANDNYFYGLKFGGFGSTEGSNGEWNFNFTYDRSPMGGDFYAKGGNDTFADNGGFGEGEGGKGAKILDPDTVIQRISISEPGTLLLFGSGLLGITVWRRRRKRMQN